MLRSIDFSLIRYLPRIRFNQLLDWGSVLASHPTVFAVLCRVVAEFTTSLFARAVTDHAFNGAGILGKISSLRQGRIACWGWIGRGLSHEKRVRAAAWFRLLFDPCFDPWRDLGVFSFCRPQRLGPVPGPARRPVQRLRQAHC